MTSHVQRFLVIVVKIDERDKRDEQAINELAIEDVFNLTSFFEKSPNNLQAEQLNLWLPC